MANDPDSVGHKNKPLLLKAPPPPEAVVVMALASLLAVYFFPSYKELGAAASPDMFVNRIFPEYLSLASLVYIRLGFSILCFSVTFHATLFSKGVEIQTGYLPGSKLKSASIRMKGILFLYPFTAWCWNLLGLSFFVSAYTSWKIQKGQSVAPWVLQASLILWEMSAPFTLMVSAIVKYAIWPQAIKLHGSGGLLMNTRPLIQHNANVLMALAELVLLGGLPIYMAHVWLSVIFGSAYVFFTWATMNHWNNGEDGPATLYFFMDTTIGSKTTIALLALLGILVFFFTVFSGVSHLSDGLGHSISSHFMFVVAVCLLVCRFRD